MLYSWSANAQKIVHPVRNFQVVLELGQARSRCRRVHYCVVGLPCCSRVTKDRMHRVDLVFVVVIVRVAV